MSLTCASTRSAEKPINTIRAKIVFTRAQAPLGRRRSHPQTLPPRSGELTLQVGDQAGAWARVASSLIGKITMRAVYHRRAADANFHLHSQLPRPRTFAHRARSRGQSRRPSR